MTGVEGAGLTGASREDGIGTDLRLLPWTRADGKPCYLRTDDDSSHLSRLADNAEEMLLTMAETLLPLAERALADPGMRRDELVSLGEQLTQSLRDTIRVAVSRGGRLPQHDATGTTGPEDEGPRLPAEAFG